MKLSIATIALFLSGATSFAPSMPALVGRGVASSAAAAAAVETTALFAKPEEEEGGGLDLDLSEMFDM